MNNLRQLLIDHRSLRKASLRKMAREIGIDHVALHHFERGKGLQLKQWSAIMKWMFSEK